MFSWCKSGITPCNSVRNLCVFYGTGAESVKLCYEQLKFSVFSAEHRKTHIPLYTSHDRFTAGEKEY